MRIRINISDSLKEEMSIMKKYSFSFVSFVMLIYFAVVFYFGAIVTIALTWLLSINITSLNFSLLTVGVFGLLCIEEFVFITAKHPTLVIFSFGLIIGCIYKIFRYQVNNNQQETISQSIEEGFLTMIMRYFAPSKCNS